MTNRYAWSPGKVLGLLGLLLAAAETAASDPIVNPAPTPASEAIRHSVGSVSPLTPLTDWDDSNTQDPDFRGPSANEKADILPYAIESGSTVDWPNVFSPLNVQGFFQDGMWPENEQVDKFAKRYEWMRGASYNAVSNINSGYGTGKTRESETVLDPAKAIVTAGSVSQAIARQGAPSAADGLVITGSLDAAAAAFVPLDWNNEAAFQESVQEGEVELDEIRDGRNCRVFVKELNGAEHNVYANRRFTQEFEGDLENEAGILAGPVAPEPSTAAGYLAGKRAR